MESLPAFFFVALVVAGLLFQLGLWRRRVRAFRALAEKFALRDVLSSDYIPDPGITGIILPARYSRMLTGTLDGVAVVAFDYKLGWGRGERLGAGVGVKMPVNMSALLPTLHHGLDVNQNNGWTFVFATPLPFARIGYGVRPEEMEDLWRKIMDTPPLLSARAPRPGASPSRPGEVHIRPRPHV